jgi:sec-independent protein translocase protein TatA
MEPGVLQILIVVGIFIILFFGAKKIPELARGIGEGMTEFKKAAKEVEESQKQEPADDAQKTEVHDSQPKQEAKSTPE